jgi:hypothetical protein
VSGKAVAQGVRMDFFLDARPLGSFLASVPGCFGIDGLIMVVPTRSGAIRNVFDN